MIIISIVTFVALLVIIIFIRVKNKKFEVKPTDIVLAILPIAIVLLVTGNLKKFEFGGLKVESAFVKASESTIINQVNHIKTDQPNSLSMKPWEPPLISPSRTLGELKNIPSRAAKALVCIPIKRAEALQFILGDGHYAGDAILHYLDSLIQYPPFQYIIIINKNGTFFGLADGRTIYNLFLNRDYSANKFAEWLNKPDENALIKMPSFRSSLYAVNERATDKNQALQKMESLNVDSLPVVNDNGQFVGVVKRDRLVASLLIDVSKRLKIN